MRTIEVHNKEQMLPYLSEVWQLLSNAYASVPGGLNYSSPKELISDSGCWRLVVCDQQVKAVTLIKQRCGRKLVAFAKSRGRSGRSALIELLQHALQTGWMEVSDGAESFIMKECQGQSFILSADLAQQLLQKPIVPVPGDAYRYQRSILGQMKSKIALGTPDVCEQNTPWLLTA